MHRRVLVADSLCFLLVAQVRKLSLSASLAWAEEALNCHTRDSDDDAAIEVLSFSSVFWVDPLVLVFSSRLADRAGGKIVIATAKIFFEEPPPGYAVLWSVSVGAVVAPVASR